MAKSGSLGLIRVDLNRFLGVDVGRFKVIGVGVGRFRVIGVDLG